MRSLAEAIDTTTPGGRLVFHVFAAVAQFERSLGLLNARRPGCRIPGRPKSHTATVTRGCDRVGMKKPGPSRAGWYDAIMQRALRAGNSPSCVGPCHHGVGFWTPAAGSGSWQARKSAAVSWYHQ
ncbi:MAG: hypothetical protein U0Q47_12395 [Mycobacterium sp.]|nr:MAG: hypothetical protein E6R02_03185 [Gammaproteobacteria bacterium]